MKKLLIAAGTVLATLTMMVPVSQAATATGTFNVNITLTSVCQVNDSATNPATISDIALTYTAFQTTTSSNTGGFNVRCTNSLPYTLAVSGPSVTDAAVGLLYTVALDSAANTGNGSDQPYVITATIGANQAGTCTTATCTNAASGNKQHTVTVTY